MNQPVWLMESTGPRVFLTVAQVMSWRSKTIEPTASYVNWEVRSVNVITSFHQKCLTFKTRWWQLKYFLFSLRTLGKWSNLTNIFQMGWNHQLEKLWNIDVLFNWFTTSYVNENSFKKCWIQEENTPEISISVMLFFKAYFKDVLIVRCFGGCLCCHSQPCFRDSMIFPDNDMAVV